MNPNFGEMLDTPPEIRRQWFAALAALTPEQRFAMIDAASRELRALVAAGIRLQEPSLQGVELELRVAERLYGEELVGPLRARLQGARP